MSDNETHIQQTQHAVLVAWGWFAEHLGLPQQFQEVTLKQKRYDHTPQTKVIEFLVTILAGSKYRQDISLAAHPLDKDQSVAEARQQPGWADYSGVSRTLSGLSWDEVRQLVAVLERISQSFIATELHLLRSQRKRICLDGDLTGIPVSNTSRSYPNAAYGHMDNQIRLGHQAALVSLNSPTCGRLSALIHYGSDPVTLDLSAWFQGHNARQTIEAGIKKCKQVFYLHHIKVRSEPAIYLQECFILFAANFIRWETHWLADQAQPTQDALNVRQMGVKRQVHVAAHVSAHVIQSSEGRFLTFSQQSAFAGKLLWLPGNHQLTHVSGKSSQSMPLLVESHLIAHPLR